MTLDRDVVVIEIPSDFESLPETKQVAFLNDLMCQLPTVSAALDVECDASASVPILERLMIQSVVVQQKRVAIEYVVEFTEFRACQLETLVWTFRRQLAGQIEQSRLIFARSAAPESRTTVDEF